MIDSGIFSFKIEGRMRSIYYIATVLHTYRMMHSRIVNNTLTDAYTNLYFDILNRCANRESVPQFFSKYPDHNEQYYSDVREEVSNKDFIGLVMDNKDGIITIEQRNNFKKGDIVQFFGPNLDNLDYIIGEMYDEEDNLIEVAPHAQMIIKIKADLPLSKGDMMRVKIFDIF